MFGQHQRQAAVYDGFRRQNLVQIPDLLGTQFKGDRGGGKSRPLQKAKRFGIGYIEPAVAPYRQSSFPAQGQVAQIGRCRPGSAPLRGRVQQGQQMGPVCVRINAGQYGPEHSRRDGEGRQRRNFLHRHIQQGGGKGQDRKSVV